jgi:MFS family permease
MSFWGGVLADRLGRKQILVGSAFIRAVLLGLFTLAILTGPVNIFIILGVAMLSACCAGLAMPAGMAMVKQVVRGDQVAHATTQNQVRWFGAITVGPSLGGVLYGIAQALPFLAACVFYAVSTVLGLFIRDTPRPEQAESGRKGWLEGFRYLIRLACAASSTWPACSSPRDTWGSRN